MKTFKEFLEEKWKTDTYESRMSGKRIFASNWSNIDNHEVGLHFKGNSNKEFTTDYTVDGSFFRQPGMKKDTGVKIANHVGRSINTFVRHMKPKSLHFASGEDKKISLHNKLANRLARKFDGKVTSYELNDLVHHKVDFNK